MISRRELEQLRTEWTLDIAVIEKDYLLGWLLAGIAAHPVLGRTWVFKGGTCLRKCYYETFRFSEDLDFTVMPGGPDDPGDLRQAFGEIAEWLREESGIELTVDSAAFRRRQNKRGKPTTQGRIAYRGPNPQPTLPKVKLDITADEVIAGRRSSARSATRTVMRRCREAACCATRSPSCSPRSCGRSPSGAGPGISTTSCTCTAIPT